MIDLIIKSLGGFTKHDRELLALESDSWRNRAIAAETTVSLFKEILTREQDRNARLESIGSHPNSENREPPNLNPIGDRRLSSWPRIRRELENKHRVKDNAQVSREEIEKTIREG